MPGLCVIIIIIITPIIYSKTRHWSMEWCSPNDFALSSPNESSFQYRSCQRIWHCFYYEWDNQVPAVPRTVADFIFLKKKHNLKNQLEPSHNLTRTIPLLLQRPTQRRIIFLCFLPSHSKSSEPLDKKIITN